MIEINECRIDQFSYEPTIREKIVALRNRGLSDSMIEFALLNEGLELRTEYLVSRQLISNIIDNVNTLANSSIISEYNREKILNDIPEYDGISNIYELTYYLEWIAETAIRSMYPEESNFRINRVAEYLCKRIFSNPISDNLFKAFSIERPVV